MLNPIKLEELYHEYSEHINNWAHDGIIEIELPLLHEYGLLEEPLNDFDDPNDLTQYFHVIESIEKVTLFNEQFAIWIVPRMDIENPTTYVFIALIQNEEPKLEIVFQTSGVYNTPKYVLKVLQHFLIDVLDTEATLNAFEKDQ